MTLASWFNVRSKCCNVVPSSSLSCRILGIILCTNDRECEQQQHFADVDTEMMEQLRQLFRIDFEMFGYDW